MSRVNRKLHRYKQPQRQVQLLVLMPLHVESQVIGAGEAAIADSTLEGLCPRVLPVVAC